MSEVDFIESRVTSACLYNFKFIRRAAQNHVITAIPGKLVFAMKNGILRGNRFDVRTMFEPPPPHLLFYSTTGFVDKSQVIAIPSSDC